MTYRPVDATGGWTQVWNGENRMVETYKGIDRLTFKYDYQGRRVEKCVYSDNTLTSRTLFVYDGFKCVEELDALNSNAVAMRHAWQPFDAGLDVILATTDGNGTAYFLHDVNKNVMQGTGANGTLQEFYSYASFGLSLGQSKAHIGHSSEMAETVINLNDYTYRYYKCDIGRWISRDPWNHELSGLNCYAYVANRPNDLYDNNGLFAPALIFIPTISFAALSKYLGIAVTAELIADWIINGDSSIIGGILSEMHARKRGHSDPYSLPIVKPGNTNCKCNPCPSDGEKWTHEHKNGTKNTHQIIYRQASYPDCTCYPQRVEYNE